MAFAELVLPADRAFLFRFFVGLAGKVLNQIWIVQQAFSASLYRLNSAIFDKPPDKVFGDCDSFPGCPFGCISDCENIGFVDICHADDLPFCLPSASGRAFVMQGERFDDFMFDFACII